ncbi:DUF1398 domain-containing protein [Algoriphagus sp. NG3]|uniref:DUF1398 domain-containing protein n=1 Tax=Algoriphagus sp. NG3 TaxID=3097546 RepID=UPI002A81D6F6|nr:DUF1398 family protein [Algoriphagus sp. NG3]WPR76108.1 DUF1398 family protein [Algoriphagus sp. NG3]
MVIRQSSAKPKNTESLELSLNTLNKILSQIGSLIDYFITEQFKQSKKMLTLKQIEEAHNKVQTGADFPAYIHELQLLGVKYYETYVSDGHAVYFSGEGNQVTTPAIYSTLEIADTSNKDQFKIELTAHQQGKSDYPTFCQDAAKYGIDKWVVMIDKMTCTYYDKNGEEVLVESITDHT